MIEALDIQVKGIVQGVGFRPFVYRMAKKYVINGWVLNATDGVFVHAEGESTLLDEFVLELSDNPPAAARVEEVTLKEVPLEGFDSFEIRFSDAAAVEKTTLVSPDLATCDDCVSELFDPHDKRYRYPFINCTNCGPRFTIIEKLPYDRKSTSMKDFPLCERCAVEYNNPLDRRFHAQPNACFECGPHLSWCEHEGGSFNTPLSPLMWGTTREESDAILARAISLLLAGKIVAVKGLGGFHLVCDADNPDALALLRTRKRRKGKAFAVMMADIEAVRRVGELSQVEEDVLSSAQRPIVLLRKLTQVSLAPGLADRLPELGVMLPYTPLQHLLLHDFAEAGGRMLVMTSGNVHAEPIVVDDGDAYVKLFGVADGFIGHDRAIRTRYDDSVVRVIRAGETGEAVQFLRRARGFAPLPLSLDWWSGEGMESSASCDVQSIVGQEDRIAGDHMTSGVEDTVAAPKSLANEGSEFAVFATGPEQKNTFTLTRSSEAFVSQHIGDLENAETYDAWLAAKCCYEALFQIHPTQIACDLHPEYLTSKWARDQGLPIIEVQHHFAHIVSTMGEHELSGPVCGIAFDGTGYGVDGAMWGGEVLLSNLSAFERFANFAYIPMPGGAAAVKHPLRMAYGVLWAFDLLDHPGATAAIAALGEQAIVCEQMIDRGLNTPMTSSVGRLFDAASALLGVCDEPTYEGEPAILLEAAMGAVSGLDDYDAAAERYAIVVEKNAATETSTAQDTSVVLLDAAHTFRALLDDRTAGVSVSVIARRFHDAFVQAVIDSALLVRGVYDIETVVLTGGVFMNRYLIEYSLAGLEAAGFRVAINRDLPPNDGCISFGQAVVAWVSNNERKKA